MALRLPLPILEIHVAHACNLACASCSHFSSSGHPGIVTLDEAEAWMRPWQDRIRPAIFGLVGGEPTLHPQLPDFVLLARRCWPDSLMVLTTNGLLLDRHPQLPATLEATGTLLRLTKHHDGPHYQAAFRGVVQLLADWSRRHRFHTEVLLAGTRWTRRYLGEGADALPYDDGDPRPAPSRR